MSYLRRVIPKFSTSFACKGGLGGVDPVIVVVGVSAVGC